MSDVKILIFDKVLLGVKILILDKVRLRFGDVMYISLCVLTLIS